MYGSLQKVHTWVRSQALAEMRARACEFTRGCTELVEVRERSLQVHAWLHRAGRGLHIGACGCTHGCTELAGGCIKELVGARMAAQSWRGVATMGA